MTVIVARRSFSLADQQSFAALSGDWNPVHVDAEAARRTIVGEPVVHGVHLVLWALDALLASGGDRRRLLAVRATFRKPAFLDRELALIADGDRLEARSADGAALELVVRHEPGEPPAWTGPHAAWPAGGAPVVLTRTEATTARGELPLALDEDRARTGFPHACARLGLATVADLLATTRLVGMHCPGLHSLFAGLALEAVPGGGAAMAYEVTRAKPAYSIVELRVRGGVLAGNLDTFYRPEPRALAMAEAVRAVGATRFDQRALVIGGSRGIGEAFSKAIAAGGGDVCLTFQRGAGDAKRVVDEIRGAGGRATAIPFDVASPDELHARWPLGGPPTHLYYFATPRLTAIKVWRGEDLDAMMRVFVAGLYATTSAALGLGGERLVVWVPSTVFLDTGQGTAPYAVAKAAMEELCRRMPGLLPVTVHAPRLGRVDTDQTAGLITLPAAAALDVAIEHLRRL